ncbi:hypothetical protein TRSC58_02825 [Trypanosoma rangeli SC58]|uniref:PDEase domain-containing protein n=1 Tax=Trypanosoma rangeli SC58 TaxID=429131 RepID=A0A061J824_TRYRA|nr:hypothetical protein TRSC58_02825 [Trypanosoma rangeli SC58]
MKTHLSHVPVTRPEVTPKERLMARFIAQLRRRLAESTTLDEFRAWVGEHAEALEASVLEVKPRQRVDMAQDIFTTPTTPGSLSECGDEGIEGATYWCHGEQGNTFTSYPSLTELFCVESPRSNAKTYKNSSRMTVASEFTPVASLPREKSFLTHSAGNITYYEDTKTEKDVTSVLQLSSLWAPSVFQRGVSKPPGRCRHGRDCETNPLESGDSYGSINQSLSLLAESIYSPAGMTHRPGAPPLPKDMSILELSNQGELSEGMPAFSLDGRLPNQGPIFSRSNSRHSPVLRPIAQVREALRALGVPFLENVESSNVDVLQYEELYGVNAYVYTCLNILLRYNFSVQLGFHVGRLLCYYNTAVKYIFWRNPFHSICHATDIVLAAYQFLQQPYVAENFSDEELFSFLFASTVMKLGHVGMSNAFLISIHHPYVAFHGFLSPQQSISIALAFALLDAPECHFPTFDDAQEGAGNSTPSLWTPAKEIEFQEMTSRLIIPTGERDHQMLLTQLQQVLQEGAGNVVRENHLMIILQNVLHAADFCYVFRSPPVYRATAARAVAEIYQQEQTRLWFQGNGVIRWPWHEVNSGTGEEGLALQTNNTVDGSPISIEDALIFTKGSHQMKAPLNSFDVPGGIAFSDASITSSAGSFCGASGFSSLHHAKVLQLTVLEVVFLPFIFTLSPFVPDYWLTNAQSNLVWLGDFHPDVFEADVMRVLRNPEFGGPRLRSAGPCGFERRVLRRILDPLFRHRKEELRK